MNIDLSPVKGTKDFSPVETDIRDNIISVITENFKRNGFLHIKTPILESLKLLTGGDSGDNQKLMFKVLKRGEKLNLTQPNLTQNDISEEGLRYDLTVPLARYYSANKETLPSPFKAFQIDEAFRADKPQRGRFRQFTQCDIDILGDESISGELEILTTLITTYEKIGLKNIVLRISSREILADILAYCGINNVMSMGVSVTLDKLDKIGFDGVEKELLEKQLDLKTIKKLLEVIKDINKNGLKVLSNFGCRAQNIYDLKTLIDIISKKYPNCKTLFDITIIRGQGYYTGTVYEFYVEGLNYTSSIGGGGRYDNMIEKMTGNKVCAVGGSIGLEPVTILAVENNLVSLKQKKLALIFDETSALLKVYDIKDKNMKKYFVSCFKRPKNFQNLLNKLKNVGFTKFSVIKDNIQGEIKSL